MISPFYWYGTRADFNVVPLFLILLLFGGGLILAGVTGVILVGVRHRSFRPSHYVILLGCLLIGFYFIYTAYFWQRSWLEGCSKLFQSSGASIFADEKVATLIKEYPVEELIRAPERIDTIAFQIAGRRPQIQYLYKSRSGWFEVGFIYGGDHQLLWGVRVWSENAPRNRVIGLPENRCAISSHSSVYIGLE